MKKITMCIEVISSDINELSSMSKESRNSIVKVLSNHYSHVRNTVINNVEDLNMLVDRKPELVFLGMKFIPAEEMHGRQNVDRIWISEHLDRNGIVYTGSNQFSHNLEFNKEQAKEIVQKAGLMTANFCVARSGQVSQLDKLPNFPLFVKPTDQGGGTGIDNKSLVHNTQELNAKVASIFSELGSDSMIEQYLPGREFSVAVLRSEDSSDYSLMPIELIAPINKAGARFLSKKIKKSDTEQFRKVVDQKIIKNITPLAMDVFIALGARDYGRIDIRLDAQGVPHFLEANLIPSLLRDYGNFPKACLLNLNLNYENMILQIVSLALARSLPITYSDFELPIVMAKPTPFAI